MLLPAWRGRELTGEAARWWHRARPPSELQGYGKMTMGSGCEPMSATSSGPRIRNSTGGLLVWWRLGLARSRPSPLRVPFAQSGEEAIRPLRQVGCKLFVTNRVNNRDTSLAAPCPPAGKAQAAGLSLRFFWAANYTNTWHAEQIAVPGTTATSPQMITSGNTFEIIADGP